MRWLLAASLILLALVSTRAHTAIGLAPLQPEPTATVTATMEAPSGTPIVDPDPQPVPLYLPRLTARYDRSEPPPIAPVALGYVAGLTRAGREACAPARHILLLEPEGTPGNTAIAALVQGLPDPNLTLDLYVAEYVEVKGTEEIAPEACRQVTSRLISVREIRVVDRPPGR